MAGSRETVGAMSRESLRQYVRSHYLPSTTILGLAGQVTHEEAVSLAQQTLGDWRNGPPVLWDPAPLDHGGPRVQIEHRDTEQAHVALSFSSLSRRDPGLERTHDLVGQQRTQGVAALLCPLAEGFRGVAVVLLPAEHGLAPRRRDRGDDDSGEDVHGSDTHS